MTKHFLLSAVISTFFLAAHGQNYSLRSANRLFNNLEYSKAIEHFLYLAEENEILEAKLKLAECYRKTAQPEKAAYWYGEFLGQPLTKPELLLYYAQAMLSNGSPDDALEWMIEYAQRSPADGRASDFIEQYEELQKIQVEAGKYEIECLSFNNAQPGFSPAFFKEGIVFVSPAVSKTGGLNTDGWTGKGFFDLMEVKPVLKKKWTTPKPFSSHLNTPFHEGPVSFDTWFERMFFTRNNYQNGKRGKSNKQITHLKIYKAEWHDGQWVETGEFAHNNDAYSVCHPALSGDGTRLIFASDMPGGLGEMDLYVSHKTGESWGPPINLGEEVNTEGCEVFPFIDAQGMLWFASNGLPGLGGYDVFFTRKKSRVWEGPENIGKPVNSNKDDFGLVWHKSNEYGYFSSNRGGGKGADDIYKVTNRGPAQAASQDALVNKGNVEFRILVIDQLTGDPVPGAMLQISEYSYGKDWIVFSDQDGLVSFVPKKNISYKANIQAEGYSIEKIYLYPGKLQSANRYFTQVNLRLLNEGRVKLATSIHFDLGQWHLRSGEKKQLAKVTRILRERPEMMVELNGHTDERGQDFFNLELSEKRAEATARHLVSLGVHPDRIGIRFHGESQPKAPCPAGSPCSESVHWKNRRTEIRLIEN